MDLAAARRYMLRVVLRPFLLVVLATFTLSAQVGGPVTANMPFSDAKPILEALHDSLPADLKARSPAVLESFWPSWVLRRDAEIRARLEQADEDSLVNFLLFGTTFTKLLSNNALVELPAAPMKRAGATTVVYSERPDDNDHVLWYVRP